MKSELLGQTCDSVGSCEVLEHRIHLMIYSLIYVLLNEFLEISLIHALIKLVRAEIIEYVLNWYLRAIDDPSNLLKHVGNYLT